MVRLDDPATWNFFFFFFTFIPTLSPVQLFFSPPFHPACPHTVPILWIIFPTLIVQQRATSLSHNAHVSEPNLTSSKSESLFLRCRFNSSKTGMWEGILDNSIHRFSVWELLSSSVYSLDSQHLFFILMMKSCFVDLTKSQSFTLVSGRIRIRRHCILH